MQRIKRKNEKRKNKILLCLCILIFLIGCGNEQPSKVKIILKKPRKKLKSHKKLKSNRIIIKTKKFVYNPSNIKRNPFKPFIKEKPVEIPLQPKNMIVTPLTEYSLDQYRLVGIITDTKPPLAMVETSDKKGLIFTIGDYIGSEYYKVVKIFRNIVVIQKKFLTGKNKIKVEKKILKIDLSGE